MRVAAIYDIHGNLPALEAVLDDVRREGVDLVVVGGDVVPGPMPVEAIALLRALDVPVRFVRGNGERIVLAQRDGVEPAEVPPPFRAPIRWCAAMLGDADDRLLRAWPATVRAAVGGLGDVCFCHATPRGDTEIFTRRTRDEAVLALLAGADAPVVVCGHTHMQFDRMVGGVRVVNAGSVGMPFGEPGAYWALLGPDVELRRTTYDLRAAAERIRRTAYPEAADFAERHVLSPPTEDAMLEAFSRAGPR